MKKYALFVIIGIPFFIVGILASPYVLKSSNEVSLKQPDSQTIVNQKEPQNKVEAFEKCVSDDVTNKIKILTMPESQKKSDDPLWFGGCNGGWAQLICETGIRQISPDLGESLTSCMYKHLY